jgi:hypothetical protein
MGGFVDFLLAHIRDWQNLKLGIVLLAISFFQPHQLFHQIHYAGILEIRISMPH